MLSFFKFIPCVIRFYIELSLSITIAFFINIFSLQLDSISDCISFVLSLLFMGMTLLLLISIQVLLIKHTKSDSSNATSLPFKEIIEELNYQRKTLVSSFRFTVFFWRRFLLVASIFSLSQDHIVNSIQIFIISNLFYTIYLIHHRPIADN